MSNYRLISTLLLCGLVTYLPSQPSMPEPAPARGVRIMETAVYLGDQARPVHRERFRYDESGQLLHRQQGDAQRAQSTAVYRYDPAGDWEGQTLTLPRSGRQAQAQWERYYSGSQLQTLRETHSGILHTFTYDAGGRLSLHLTQTRRGLEVAREQRTYDAAGRLTEKEAFMGLIHERETFRYDAQDRLAERRWEKRVSFEDRRPEVIIEQYDYDAAGRLIRKCLMAEDGQPGTCQVLAYDTDGYLSYIRCGVEELRYTRDPKTGLTQTQAKYVNGRLVARKTFTYTFWPGIPLALTY